MLEYLDTIIKSDFTKLAFVCLVVVPLYIKMGVFKKNGNGNGYQPQIDELKEHAKVANEEMRDVKRDISTIKVDIAFIRGKFEKYGKR